VIFEIGVIFDCESDFVELILLKLIVISGVDEDRQGTEEAVDFSLLV
jgi:hypothetical protein